MKVTHDYHGTKHRLVVNGKTSPWASLTGPAVFKLGPKEFMVAVTEYGRTPLFRNSNVLYIVAEGDELPPPTTATEVR